MPTVLAALAALLLAQSGTPVAAKPYFTDRAAATGLSLGGDAACWVDLDNDGWPDLVTGTGAWHNDKGARFTRMGDFGDCVAADFDNDGYVDLFSWTQLRLYRNVAGKEFKPVELPALPTSSRGACWGDFDNDGFVDLYIGGYEDWDRQITYPSYILMNQGGKSFKIAWTEETYRTRGVTACDFNQDGAIDVYVSNYRLQNNVLRLNDGKGHFRDAAPEYNVVATSPGFDGGHSIGACWGDFDNDGLIDLFAGNFAHVDSRGDQPKSRFLQNLGPAAKYHFRDLGTCGVFYQESYASPACGDYDNDGDLDLLFTTVYGVASFGRPNNPVLYRNDGAIQFGNATATAGMTDLPPTYQAAWADYDRDGKLDVVCGGKLFHNDLAQGNWIEVRLKGDGRAVNSSAIGAQVRIRLGRQTLTRQVEAGTGEGNQNDLVLHFGLGSHKRPVDLEILWPGGGRQVVRRAKPGTVVAVAYAPAKRK